jgi:hypothetical protein
MVVALSHRARNICHAHSVVAASSPGTMECLGLAIVLVTRMRHYRPPGRHETTRRSEKPTVRHLLPFGEDSVPGPVREDGVRRWTM